VSWVRVDCDVPMDGRLCGTGHAWAWPAVVARAKAGDGRILQRECSARVMAYLWGPSVEAWEQALLHFVAEGLLIEDGDAYLVAGWDDYQRDNTGAERQRRHRASVAASRRNGDVTDCHVTSRDVTASNGDVTSRHVTSRDGHAYSTVQDRTVQDRTTTSSSSSPPPQQQPKADEDDDLKVIVSTWLGTQLTERGHTRMQATGHELAELQRALRTHGRERTVAAIGAAANSAEGGTPRLALFTAIVERGVFDGPPSKAPSKAKQSQAKTDKPDSKRVNAAWAGVADQGDTF
jgi:hypothetical protein